MGDLDTPEQHRAISIREGALLQSFPLKYKFLPKEEQVHCTHLGRLIGNAVPVQLGKAIGKSFLLSAESFLKKKV